MNNVRESVRDLCSLQRVQTSVGHLIHESVVLDFVFIDLQKNGIQIISMDAKAEHPSR